MFEMEVDCISSMGLFLIAYSIETELLSLFPDHIDEGFTNTSRVRLRKCPQACTLISIYLRVFKGFMRCCG